MAWISVAFIFAVCSKETQGSREKAQWKHKIFIYSLREERGKDPCARLGILAACQLSPSSLPACSCRPCSGTRSQVRGEHARQRGAGPRVAAAAGGVSVRGVSEREPAHRAAGGGHARPHPAVHEPRWLRGGCRPGTEPPGARALRGVRKSVSAVPLLRPHCIREKAGGDTTQCADPLQHCGPKQ